MREAVLTEPRHIEVRNVPVPETGEGEALIAPAVVGICGSDMHTYHGEHPFAKAPLVPGHEFAAVVLQAPEEGEFKPGDRVTVEPNLVCGECRNCREGRYNICESLKVIGFQAPGAMADVLAVPVEKLIHLPQTMAFDDACLIEPLAVGIHTMKRARLQPGENVLILGAGTIGLMCVQAARAMEAGSIAVTDLQDWRLELARCLGANATIKADSPDLRAAIRKEFGPDGADIVLECTGHGAAVQSAIAVSRKGGRILIVGVHGEPVDLNVGLVQDWELDVLGALMYTRQDFIDAIRLIAEGRIQTRPFITHRFPLEEVATAYATLDDPSARALKVLVQIDRRSGRKPQEAAR